jgi:hypothetical protein
LLLLVLDDVVFRNISTGEKRKNKNIINFHPTENTVKVITKKSQNFDKSMIRTNVGLERQKEIISQSDVKTKKMKVGSKPNPVDMMPFSSSMLMSCLLSFIDGVCTFGGSTVAWLSPRMTYFGSDFVRSIKGINSGSNPDNSPFGSVDIEIHTKPKGRFIDNEYSATDIQSEGRIPLQDNGDGSSHSEAK